MVGHDELTALARDGGAVGWWCQMCVLRHGGLNPVSGSVLGHVPVARYTIFTESCGKPCGKAPPRGAREAVPAARSSGLHHRGASTGRTVRASRTIIRAGSTRHADGIQPWARAARPTPSTPGCKRGRSGLRASDAARRAAPPMRVTDTLAVRRSAHRCASRPGSSGRAGGDARRAPRSRTQSESQRLAARIVGELDDVGADRTDDVSARHGVAETNEEELTEAGDDGGADRTIGCVALGHADERERDDRRRGNGGGARRPHARREVAADPA